jgi:hypothetical protein
LSLFQKNLPVATHGHTPSSLGKFAHILLHSCTLKMVPGSSEVLATTPNLQSIKLKALSLPDFFLELKKSQMNYGAEKSKKYRLPLWGCTCVLLGQNKRTFYAAHLRKRRNTTRVTSRRRRRGRTSAGSPQRAFEHQWHGDNRGVLSAIGS